MAPLIALNTELRLDGNSCLTELTRAYPAAVQAAGGAPLLLPPVDPANLDRMLDLVHGVVLVGGFDYHPDAYGEAPHPKLEPMVADRHHFDLALAAAALARRLPVLGICGGCQLLNLALEGSLIQDLPTEVGEHVVHGSSAGFATRHDVRVSAGSRLAGLCGTELVVNSWHHQAVRRPGRGLEPVAWAPDGVIEAIELRDYPFALGVQWHPEEMPGEAAHQALFAALIAAARVRAGSLR